MSDVVNYYRQPRSRSGPLKEHTSNERVVKIVGIDLSKRSFHGYGVDERGQRVISTGPVNQIRGLLLEYGIEMPQGRPRTQALVNAMFDSRNAAT